MSNVPSFPSVASSVSPARPANITVDWVFAEIQRRSKLSVEDMTAIRRAVKMPGWAVGQQTPVQEPFVAFDAAGNPLVDPKTGKPVSTHIVAGLFYGGDGDRTDDHIAGDVRAYCAPKSMQKEADGELPGFYRVTMNRQPGVAQRVDILSLDAFIQDMALEMKSLFVEMDADDEDEEEELEEEETLTCGECGKTDLPSEYEFCPSCAAQLEKPVACALCETEMDAGQKFCHECGTQAAVASPAATPSPTSHAAPHPQVYPPAVVHQAELVATGLGPVGVTAGQGPQGI